MQADLLKREVPKDLTGKVAVLRAGLHTLAENLREVSHKLHPSIIADLGLTEALESLTGEFRSQRLSLRTSLAKVEDLSLDVSTSIYRIAQESLNTVLKHAPASPVRVNLTASDTELNLRIADDGQVFSLGDVRRRGGLGLISMQGRARLVWGNLLLTAEPNKGTTVLVRVPSMS